MQFINLLLQVRFELKKTIHRVFMDFIVEERLYETNISIAWTWQPSATYIKDIAAEIGLVFLIIYKQVISNLSKLLSKISLHYIFCKYLLHLFLKSITLIRNYELLICLPVHAEYLSYTIFHLVSHTIFIVIVFCVYVKIHVTFEYFMPN